MSWSVHQQALLREIGVRLWLAPVREAAGADAGAPVLHDALPDADVAAGRPVPAMRLDDGPRLSARPQPQTPPTPVAHPAPAVVPPVGGVRGATAPASVGRPVLTSPAPADAVGPASGVAAMDWDMLQATVSACRACSLCDSRRQTVFGVGHPQARVMLVGEAPGEQEDRDGEPFVGKAGQLLDNMLRATGLTRAEAGPERQVYIANVLKCRPPQNRNPLPEEVARCEPYLRRQVALVQPEVIIAMGRFAVQSLLASQEPIGRLRGRVHEFAGIPVVVTYHPAYLLRNPLDKSRSWEDLCLAREVLGRRSAGEA